MFNKILEVEKIKLYSKGGDCYCTYEGLEEIKMPPYLLEKDKINMYIIQSSNSNGYDYIDYLEGEYIKPSLK